MYDVRTAAEVEEGVEVADAGFEVGVEVLPVEVEGCAVELRHGWLDSLSLSLFVETFRDWKSPG